MRPSKHPVWLAPDAPADQRPTALHLRPLSALGVTAGVASKLAAAGLRTVGDLDRYEQEGGDISQIRGVGPGTTTKIKAARAAWENAQ